MPPAKVPVFTYGAERVHSINGKAGNLFLYPRKTNTFQDTRTRMSVCPRVFVCVRPFVYKIPEMLCPKLLVLNLCKTQFSTINSLFVRDLSHINIFVKYPFCRRAGAVSSHIK